MTQNSGWFEKGHIPWHKGKTGVYSIEARNKIRETFKGKHLSKEHREKIRKANKGSIPWNKGNHGLISEETRKKMSKASTGRKSPKRGKTWSDTRRKAQEARKNSHYASFGKPKLKKDRSKESNNSRKPVILGNKKEYHPDWREIRKEIYKRDNWTCQECGIKCHCKVKIQCHHIDVNINNNDEFNLITLCASCHMKVHFTKNDWARRLRWKVISTNKKKEDEL